MMKRILFIVHCSLFIIALAACSGDSTDPYPPIITEFVDVHTDGQGYMHTIRTDTNVRYTISQTLSGYRPDTTYRCVCGYVPEGTQATLYQLIGARCLRDSTAILHTDPIDVYSVWATPRYLNMHLRPMTQGGLQYWGYAVDSIRSTTAYLHLHHSQAADPLAYSADVYASLPLDSLPARNQLATIQLTIETFKGAHTYTLTPPSP